MRVLALTNLYPNPYQPNRATFNRNRFRLLNDCAPVRVIAPVSWTDAVRARWRGEPKLPAGEIEFDGLPVSHPIYWFTPRALRRSYGRFFEFSVRGAFERALREFTPDVVFAPWAYPDAWGALRLARRHDLPMVALVHGSDVRMVDKHPGRAGRTGEAIRGADGVIAMSDDLRDRCLGMGARPDAVRTILDGVDLARMTPVDARAARAELGFAAAARHLLFVGNLHPVKGLDVLLKACERLDGDWRLHLVGEGPQRPALERQAKASGLGERVSFHGGAPHSDVPKWMSAADLFVLPSRSEGVPNVLLEAAACGLPYVASNVGGIPEIAALGDSRLVPPEDPEALAEGLRTMLARGRRSDGPRPRDIRESVAEQYEFLQEIVARRRRGPKESR
ncbi:MAG TPA: glycosyltransferase [Planctomycetia bacterium]|nr:glycosyltransferase [Planctomycetia bacterium]